MSVDLNIYKPFLLRVSRDSRTTVWHLALMFGIIQLADSNDSKQPILISRRKLIEASHFCNFVTYHKCLKELQELGYIDYLPSYHPGIRSRVFLLT